MSATSRATINLLLVDDHAMFREGVARMIEKEPDFKVVGQAKSASEALMQLIPSCAGIVLLDVDLGSERAIDFMIAARELGFQGKVLIVTAGISDQEAVQLIQSGVAGILHKKHSTVVLCDSLRRVANGEVFLEKEYLGSLFRVVERTEIPRRRSLTERDKAVLRGLLQGFTNREIGAQLDITEGAVKSALHYTAQKLGVRTRAQLVKVALEELKDQL